MSFFFLKNVNERRTALVKNLIKENFYEKRKKTINILTVFFISYKSDVKIFLKWILKQCYTALVNMIIILFCFGYKRPLLSQTDLFVIALVSVSKLPHTADLALDWSEFAVDLGQNSASTGIWS